MNRQKHKLSRRILAVLLMAAMLITMLPSAMFAAPTEPTPASGQTTEVSTPEDSPIQITKSVENTEDGLNLVIDAWATGEKTTSQTVKPVDIVLVLDQSGSMAEGTGSVVENYSQASETQWSYDSIAGSWRRDYFYYSEKDQAYYPVDAIREGERWNHQYSIVYYKDDEAVVLAGPESSKDDVHYNGTLYTRTISETSKLSALKDAVNAFVDTVNDNSPTTGKHRIAVVGFASNSSSYYKNTEIFVGNTQYRYSDYPVYNEDAAQNHYADALQDADSTNLKDSVNALAANGGTYTNLGVEMANGILGTVQEDDRQKVIIVFTDGEPGRNGYDLTVANAAISQANKARDNNVTVYSVGVFGKDKDHRVDDFMRSLAGSQERYFNAEDPSGLTAIFETIAEEIGSATVEANENSALTDVISDYFTVDNVNSGRDITVETVPYAGGGEWGNAQSSGLSATFDGKNVSVKGFDYSENYVWDSEDGHGGGRALRLTIPIKADTAYTQWGESGYYDTNTSTTLSYGDNEKVELKDSPNAWVDTYQVTYYSDGGSIVTDEQHYIAGQTATVKNASTKDGFEFKGWKLDETTTYQPASSITISGDVILTAQWEANAFDLKYDANGGTFANENEGPVSVNDLVAGTYNLWAEDENVTNDQQPTTETAWPTHAQDNNTDVVMIGWTAEKDTQIYAKGDIAPTTINKVTITNNDVTVYAVWGYDTNGNDVPDVNENWYTVTYDSNGGTGEMVDNKSPYAENSNVTVLNNTFTKAGHTFTGWNTAKDGKGTAYKADETFQITENTTLYAQWKANEYTVKYDSNGGEGTMTDDNAYQYNANVTVRENAFTRDGYTFTGWNTAKDGKGTAYKADETFQITENTTLYAQWKANEYTVKYDSNGGEGTMTDDNAYQYNANVTVQENAFTRDGYTFTGWNTAQDGSGISYEEDAIFAITANTTLYAQWKENPKYISGFTKEVLTQDEIAALDVEDTYDNPVNKGDKVLVEENGSVTFLYKLTVKGDPGASFKVTDPGAVLVKANIGIAPGTQNVFDGEIPEDGSDVVLYVSLKHENIAAGEKQLWNKAEITSDEINDDVDPDLEVPVDIEVIPTPVFEKLIEGAVQVDCITEEVDHGSKDPATYDLIKDAYTVTGSGAHYEISISADQANYYIAQYNKDVEPDHVYDNMPNGNTIILNYKGDGKWETQQTPIVIAVRCAAPDDVTAFDKNVITSNDVDNLPDDVKSRTDYVVPAYNNGKIETVTVPKNGTVTLLYVIKVEGSAGTTFTVSDPGANLVYSAYDVTEGDNDTFTGTISKDGSATFYVTRTFTSDEVGAEAEGMLRNSASITVDDGTVKEDEKDEDEDVPAEVGPETDVVKVTPADVTIYEGGKGGYNGVGDASGNIASEEDSSSLPHPMFYIYTPDGVNADGLTFGNGEKTWTAVYDGKDAEGNPLYHFTEGEGQDPVRVTYTYVDPVTKVETTVLADDLDELDNVTDVYTYLRIDLYAGDNNLETVKANVNGVGYAIDTASGRLTVRAVEADDPNTVTSDIQETAPTEDLGTAVAVEPENTTYTFNDTEVVLPADSQPSLLFDNIINDDVDRTSALEDKADQKLNANDGDYNYEIMYLDLVDANNGNAWIKSSEGTDIYWDYPEGTDKNTDFEVLHFTGLHRDGEESGFDINDLNTITMDEIENVTIEKTDDYIVFHVTEANFSPYALAWEDDGSDTPDYPDYPIWTPDGDDDGPSGLNTEDHFSYVVGYAEDYRTGEATDDEDLWPVKPNNQITRAEVATIFYRLLEDEVRDEYDTTTNDFSDVTADSWYNQTVSTLARMGIVKGYEDGTFRPNAPITRAEFGAIATRFFAETGATYEPGTFTDVTGNEWFANAIQDAVNLGLIGGYPDGTVRPNNNITRAEACAIVNRTLGRVPDADHLLPEDVMKVWPDNNPTDWFYADMQEATNGHEYAWIEEDGHEIEEWTNLLDKDWTDR